MKRFFQLIFIYIYLHVYICLFLNTYIRSCKPFLFYLFVDNFLGTLPGKVFMWRQTTNPSWYETLFIPLYFIYSQGNCSSYHSIIHYTLHKTAFGVKFGGKLVVLSAFARMVGGQSSEIKVVIRKKEPNLCSLRLLKI